MLSARQERSGRTGAEQGLAAHARRTEAGAVKGVPERHRLEAAGGGAGHLERDLHRVGPAGREEHFAEIARRHRGQTPRQRHRGLAGVPARGEGKVVELLLDGRDEARVAVADVMHRVAVEIHEAATGMVLDPDPLRLADLPRDTVWKRTGAGSSARLLRAALRSPPRRSLRPSVGARRRDSTPLRTAPAATRSRVLESAGIRVPHWQEDRVQAPSPRDRGRQLRKVRRYPGPRPAHSREGRKLRSGHQRFSLPEAGAPLETPISSRMLSTAASAPRISAGPRRPMQPMRNEGAAVSLPG